MPKIPTISPAKPVDVQVPEAISPQMAAYPWEQIAAGAREITQAFKALKDAQDSTEYAGLMAETTGFLQNLKFNFANDQEIDTIEERANEAVRNFRETTLAKIKSAKVAEAFAPSFDKMAAPALISVRKDATTRQIKSFEAKTLTALDQLEQSYYKATDFIEQDQIMGKIKGMIEMQVNAGIFNPVEGVKLLDSITSRMVANQVREDIRERPRGALKDLLDGKYEGLEEDDRLQLIEVAQREIEAQDRLALQIQARKDREAAKEQKQLEDDTDMQMRSLMADGQLTRRWLDEQRRTRAIDRSSYQAGLTWLETGGGNVDDHPTVNRLNDKILAEEDAKSEINNAYSQGLLSFDTFQTMKKDNDRRQDAKYNRVVRDAEEWLLNKLAIPTGELVALKADEASRKADAQLQFKIKLEENIPPMIAAREVLQSIQPIIAVPLMRLPVPPYGKGRIKNSEDLAEAVTWLFEQVQSGMPKSEIIYWHDILNRYQEIDMKFGIENLLKGIESQDRSREQAIQKQFEERGMREKGTREFK